MVGAVVVGLAQPAAAATTITSASDSPDPANVGQTITFTVGWTTDDSSSVRAVICKTNAVSSGPSCPGGSWAIGTASSTSPSTATRTAAQGDVGTNAYYAFACQGSTCSSSIAGTFTVLNATPSISSASDSPDPATKGASVSFTVGWSDAGDTAKAVICRTNAAAAGTCPGGTWATGSLSASSPSTASYTTTQADVGTNTYYAFACDAAGACSSSISGTFTINNATPGITSASDSPDPATAGETVTFSVGWSDMGDTVKALICKTNAVSSGTCPGGAWATSVPTSSSPATATYSTTPLDIGTHTYYAFACDTANLCSGAISGTFTVAAGYFSDHCTGTGSSTLVEGYAGDVFVRLRTLPVGSDTTWACVAVDGGGVHVGGKAVVIGSTPGTLVDDDVDACVGDPGDLVNRQGTIGPNNDPYNVHVIVHGDEVHVCVRATNGVAKRLTIPVSAVPTATFLPDPTGPHAPAGRAPTNPALVSSSCQSASTGVTRFVNMGAAGSHAWLYGWESATRTHVCVRAEGASSGGGRLTVDANGGQTVVTTGTDFAPCTANVVTDEGSPPFAIRISDPGSVPASVCLKLDSTQVRVTVAAGSQGVVTWTPDS